MKRKGPKWVVRMPSMRSRALAHVLRQSLRRAGDLARMDNPVHVRLIRELYDLVGHAPLPPGTRVRPVSGPGMRGRWVAARTAVETAGAVLYLHGGGFVLGGPGTHQHLAAALSAASGLPVLLLEYRRAPEHPFPAAADDALAAYRWLRAVGHPAERIGLAGDSAGGHLAAGLLADLARGRRAMPAAAVLISPFLDLTGAGLDARDAARRDPVIAPDRARECALAYAGAGGLGQRRLDVLRGDKRRWPPVLIQAGDTECLLGDSERLAAAVEAAGGHCELQVWPGQVHVFPAYFPIIPEGRAALRQAGTFLARAVADAGGTVIPARARTGTRTLPA